MKSAAPKNPVRLAVLFPGQGSQQQGMGKTLLAAYPAAEARLEALSPAAGTDLVALLCQAPLVADPVSVHLAMVGFGLVAWEFLLAGNKGGAPAFVAGHSLGEITALACAGVLPPEDALRLARVRGECMAETARAQSGGMLALVGAPLTELRRACAAWRDGCKSPAALWEANVNGPEQLVVSGGTEPLAQLAAFLKKEGVRAVPLKTAGAFHTPMMHDAAGKFAAIAATFPTHVPRIPVVSSMSGRLLTRCRGLAVHLALQMVQPVQWLPTMRFLQRAQVDTVLEAGPPGGALDSLARQLDGWQVRRLFAPHPDL